MLQIKASSILLRFIDNRDFYEIVFNGKAKRFFINSFFVNIIKQSVVCPTLKKLHIQQKFPFFN